MLVQKYVAAFMYFQDAATLGKTSLSFAVVRYLDCGFEHRMGLLPLSAHTYNPLSHKADRGLPVALWVCASSARLVSIPARPPLHCLNNIIWV